MSLCMTYDMDWTQGEACHNFFLFFFLVHPSTSLPCLNVEQNGLNFQQLPDPNFCLLAIAWMKLLYPHLRQQSYSPSSSFRETANRIAVNTC